ncbi:MAG: toll/interleukin-1 receptor domain-containing protein [Lachnospiraceae bacterium]|nr:toll/interleukin-1 receptor domain-containing protein [Lachnospiraceae bacterium]
MAEYTCKMCGGNLLLVPGQSVAVCEYCDAKQTIPVVDNEKKLTLFSRAERMRRNCDFDKAESAYARIAAEFPQEAEGYWGECLCRYGIEYVDDPADGRKVPTCHRTLYTSILEDQDYRMAFRLATEEGKALYEAEAKEIDRLQKAILEIARKEQPYDIFICYKETDDNRQRTKDSVLAQNIYDVLTEKGYRVFFARITLEDKGGEAYEPIIFAALNSARIMLAVGTSYENYTAVWVKNEWARYLELMRQDRSRLLIPCYADIDAYDMPEEFQNLQGQDMNRIGFLQDLVRGIGKVLRPEGQEGGEEQTVSDYQRGKARNLIRRALEKYDNTGDGRGAAEAFLKKAIDEDEECTEACFWLKCVYQAMDPAMAQHIYERIKGQLESGQFASVRYDRKRNRFLDNGDGAWDALVHAMGDVMMEPAVRAYNDFDSKQAKYLANEVLKLDRTNLYAKVLLFAIEHDVAPRNLLVVRPSYSNDLVPVMIDLSKTDDEHYRALAQLYTELDEANREKLRECFEKEIKEQEEALANLRESWYQKALAAMTVPSLSGKAKKIFEMLGDYKDSAERASRCGSGSGGGGVFAGLGRLFGR